MQMQKCLQNIFFSHYKQAYGYILRHCFFGVDFQETETTHARFLIKYLSYSLILTQHLHK